MQYSPFLRVRTSQRSCSGGRGSFAQTRRQALFTKKIDMMLANYLSPWMI
jgi:hypothetical protein